MSERENDEGVVLAEPDSLLGMLQRGRGKGFLLASETPPQEVWPLLLECITNDPRLDQQCEDRAEYYASLILHTGMDVEPIQAYVRRTEERSDDVYWEIVLALQTLEQLAVRGSNQARKILRDYLRYGSEWVWITEILTELAAPEVMAGIDEVLYERISNDPDLYEQLQDRIEEDWAEYCQSDEETRQKWPFLLPMSEPWRGLCEKNAELAGLFSRNGLPYDPPPAVPKMTDADVTDLSVDDLLSTVDKASFYPSWRALIERVSAEDEDRLLQSLSSDNEYRVMLALRGLGELGTPRAFEAVKSYIESSQDAVRRVRGRAFDAIERMPGSLTLDTAREWFGRKEWYLHVAAGGILENHATPEDIPLLIEALRTPETLHREDFRLSSAVNAMARFEGIGPVLELEHVFCGAQSCFDRYRAAEAMAATSPVHFTADYAFECLWDCHWDTRKLGCEMVSLSADGAIERLRELTADLNESERVREQAQTRLEGF